MTRDPRLWAIVTLFDLNTVFFQKALLDLDERQLAQRPGDQNANLAYLACHLVESRAWTARFLGGDCPAPFGGRFEHRTPIESIAEYPLGSEARRAWDEVSAVAREAILQTASQLDSPSSISFPRVPPTVLGTLAFLIHHESYHIGQLGFLRKFVGGDPLSVR